MRTLAELRAGLAAERPGTASFAVRALFALRRGLGRLFGWDHDPSGGASTYLDRLSDEEREASLVEPGSPEGPFRALYVSEREAISEIRNATVHAFSVFALIERPPDYRLYWAIYVRPVGHVTQWYMRLIDPFRRLIVYPAMLGRIEEIWSGGSAS